jgi:hypothetical protein
MFLIARSLLLTIFAATPALRAQDTGPGTLVITYRCTPDKRPDLRNYMRQAGLQQLEGYRRNAILSGYRILFSRYVDTNNWDLMVMLSFAQYADAEKWKRVERDSPAGLPPNMLALTISVSTYPADLMRVKAADEAPLQPAYLVIPYTWSVSKSAYAQYVDDYMTPQLDGWMAEGVLARYEIFAQRYNAGRPWDSLLLLEYKDDESLGSREKIMNKVRTRLQSNPKWKAMADNKQSIRTEKEAIVADEIALPR